MTWASVIARVIAGRLDTGTIPANQVGITDALAQSGRMRIAKIGGTLFLSLSANGSRTRASKPREEEPTTIKSATVCWASSCSPWPTDEDTAAPTDEDTAA
jgi:hypothetical protein